MTWDELQYWRSDDWIKVQERLDDCDRRGISYCPGRHNLFRSLDDIEVGAVKVAIIGQDPYPNPIHATGLAFSIPADQVGLPPTLETIFKEYTNDLHYPTPSCGDLSDWSRRGVLLWNAIPSCQSFKSASHDWPEWRSLTEEITHTLAKEGIVFVLLGSLARSLSTIVNIYSEENRVIELCHPSPRAVANAKTEAKFLGSRVFSRANDYLVSLGRSPIDWRLP